MLSPDLWNLLDELGHPRMLVVGDLRLERWAWGDLESSVTEPFNSRLQVQRREIRLSGAARVCQMLLDLEAEVGCAGYLGEDPDGALLRNMLVEGGVEDKLLVNDPSLLTPNLQHLVGRAGDMQLAHHWSVYEPARTSHAASLEKELADRLVENIGGFDALVFVDRGLGTCSPTVIRGAIAAAREAGKPVIVAPASAADWSDYAGATAIVVERTEAETAGGILVRNPEDALKVGAALCRQYRVGNVFVILGDDGIAVAKPQGRGKHVPTMRRGIGSVPGTDEMAAAAIGACVAANIDPTNAARLANIAVGAFLEYAAGRPIDRALLRSQFMQVSPLSGGKVLSRENLVKRIQLCRSQRQRIVFTNGCFDLLHAGHVTYLQEAAAMGDILVVGLNSDASVRRLKGPMRPVIREEDRATVLAALSCVNYVSIFDEPTPAELLRLLRPDVLVKGGDYRVEEVVGSDFVQSYGGRVYIAPLVEGVSTTMIIKSMAA